MAVMWPKRLPPDVLNNPLRSTEVGVYNSLARELDDSWHVFYSRPWLGLTATGEERDGECDFVLAHVTRGILFIEVKGGAVAWNPESDKWTSRDRHGITHSIKDPVAQARTSKHQLLRKLKERRGFERRYISVQHGVVLPDSVAPGRDLGPDRPLRIFCFADTYARHFGDWVHGRFRDEPDDATTGAGLGPDGLHALRDMLARPFQLDICLRRVVAEEDQQIDFLTQQQFHLLDAISLLPRVMIQGGAGTGKTILAMHIARSLASAGARTLLVCYNRPLAEHLEDELRGIERLSVTSFHQLCYSVLSQAGMKVPGRHGSDREFFESELPLAAEDQSSHPDVERYDAIIVDEGQDFREAWWLLLESLLDPDGSGVMRVFCDCNQRVYGNASQLVREMQLARIQLTWNLRNTKAIHEVAYLHYEGWAVSCGGPAGEVPKYIVVPTNDRIPTELKMLLDLLIGTHDIAPHDIAVLVSSARVRSEIAGDRACGGLAFTDATHQREGAVVLETVRRFKGLEALIVVIVVDAEIAASEELSYVAVSRARTRAFLIGQRRHIEQFSIPV
jgi:hypothetical protein